jgi:hypothetical protein
VLLKVDIVRAFDTIAWPFILEILQHMGFSSKWLDWTSALLSLGSTQVLLNGTLGSGSIMLEDYVKGTHYRRFSSSW